ncbi:hypothetical protein H696_01291 [Fonticula alba]|uniref:CCHC-type domain-containing protein n=1 Tax=Fonticula alba TaxID=691883 RepID=A0A058ZEK1_FONAL|nr:hypothetical protein H696_01291 [Fonticula alba]KCV71882.1 hypothetical protein H696_01291 [Fonticula alba]|eukprot:XP_009493460.1 hypothetical protein H696_01291 [Fonticula alba]
MIEPASHLLNLSPDKPPLSSDAMATAYESEVEFDSDLEAEILSRIYHRHVAPTEDPSSLVPGADAPAPGIELFSQPPADHSWAGQAGPVPGADNIPTAGSADSSFLPSMCPIVHVRSALLGGLSCSADLSTAIDANPAPSSEAGSPEGVDSPALSPDPSADSAATSTDEDSSFELDSQLELEDDEDQEEEDDFLDLTFSPASAPAFSRKPPAKARYFMLEQDEPNPRTGDRRPSFSIDDPLSTATIGETGLSKSEYLSSLKRLAVKDDAPAAEAGADTTPTPGTGTLNGLGVPVAFASFAMIVSLVRDMEADRLAEDGAPEEESFPDYYPRAPERPDGRLCVLCGVRGHWMQRCPEERCFECSGVGHRARFCPQRTGGLTARRAHRCSRCNALGHQHHQCHTIWRVYTPSELAVTSAAKATAALAAGRPVPRRGLIIRRWCYHCGERGHLGDDCTRRSFGGIFSSGSGPSGAAYRDLSPGPPPPSFRRVVTPFGYAALQAAGLSGMQGDSFTLGEIPAPRSSEASGTRSRSTFADNPPLKTSGTGAAAAAAAAPTLGELLNAAVSSNRKRPRPADLLPDQNWQKSPASKHRRTTALAKGEDDKKKKKKKKKAKESNDADVAAHPSSKRGKHASSKDEAASAASKKKSSRRSSSPSYSRGSSRKRAASHVAIDAKASKSAAKASKLAKSKA